MDTLESRIARLEAIEAIRQLKARYLSACDQKDLEGIRDCFLDGDVVIDFDRVGRFQSAEELLAVFRQYGDLPHIVEMHHGQNPQITVLGADHASATWGLYYHLIDTESNSVTQLGGFYEDEYRMQTGDWKISTTRFRVSSTLILDLADGVARSRFAGRAAPAELDTLEGQSKA